MNIHMYEFMYICIHMNTYMFIYIHIHNETMRQGDNERMSERQAVTVVMMRGVAVSSSVLLIMSDRQ